MKTLNNFLTIYFILFHIQIEMAVKELKVLRKQFECDVCEKYLGTSDVGTCNSHVLF